MVSLSTMLLLPPLNFLVADIFDSHEDDSPEPIPSPSQEHGACPVCIFCAHRCKCYACGTKVTDTICTIHMTTEFPPEEPAASNSSDFKGVSGS